MSSTTRKTAYETKDETNENLERLTKRFSSDLRTQIRKLSIAPLFSSEWMAVSETIENISKIAALENRASNLPQLSSANKNNANLISPTRKKKSNIITSPTKTTPVKLMSPSKTSSSSASSLWEREELCVRYIVEESKVNLLISLMSEFKKTQRKIRDGLTTCTEIAITMNIQEPILVNRMVAFETYLGQLLHYCFSSIEVLQTTDINYLIDYCSDVLDSAVSPRFSMSFDKEKFGHFQEIFLFEYIRVIVENAEKLNEEVIGLRLFEKGIVKKGVALLEKLNGLINADNCFVIARSLSAVLESEYFRTRRSTLFETEEEKKSLLSLEESCIKQMLTDYDRKKALRELTDTISRLKPVV